MEDPYDVAVDQIEILAIRCEKIQKGFDALDTKVKYLCLPLVFVV
jgi:hypothetical protein